MKSPEKYMDIDSLTQSLNGMSDEQLERIKEIIAGIQEGRQHKGLELGSEVLKMKLEFLICGLVHTESELFKLLNRFANEYGLQLMPGESGKSFDRDVMIEKRCFEEIEEDLETYCFQIDASKRAIFVYVKSVDEGGVKLLPCYL